MNKEHINGSLIPYEVIVKATGGDPEAIRYVLNRFDKIISYYSRKYIRNQFGLSTYLPDSDIMDEVRIVLINAITTFKI